MTKKRTRKKIRQDISIGYRRGDTQGVACFTSSDDNVLFPGSGSRVTNGPHPTFSVWESLPSRSNTVERRGKEFVGGANTRSCLSTTKAPDG